MGFWEAVVKSAILGTVQGLTEFLPVSSSGHLTLLQQLLRFDLGGAGGMFFNILLHLGTLTAVVAVLFREIPPLFHRPYKPLLMLIAATVPAGVAGVLFSGGIEGLFTPERNANWLSCLALCFSLTAVLLLVAEISSVRRKKTFPLGWKQSTGMGLMQAVALFPGISRSGSTIAAGVLLGAERKETAKFSFLMSIPVILGSLLVEFVRLAGTGGAGAGIGMNEIVGMTVGVIFSAVSGFFAAKFMLKVINQSNYKWFAFYLVILSFTCFWLNTLHVL